MEKSSRQSAYKCVPLARVIIHFSFEWQVEILSSFK
jgi:hypothetical protein